MVMYHNEKLMQEKNKKGEFLLTAIKLQCNYSISKIARYAGYRSDVKLRRGIVKLDPMAIRAARIELSKHILRVGKVVKLLKKVEDEIKKPLSAVETEEAENESFP